MRVQIRLLGPVDAVGDDGSVRHSGSALRRTLLSLLALRPGQVLAPDWLLEHLWAKDQPDSGLRARVPSDAGGSFSARP
jgi:DNA-binding SARP family transcriptional activator